MLASMRTSLPSSPTISTWSSSSRRSGSKEDPAPPLSPGNPSPRPCKRLQRDGGGDKCLHVFLPSHKGGGGFCCVRACACIFVLIMYMHVVCVCACVCVCADIEGALAYLPESFCCALSPAFRAKLFPKFLWLLTGPLPAGRPAELPLREDRVEPSAPAGAMSRCVLGYSILEILRAWSSSNFSFFLASFFSRSTLFL